MKYMGNMDKKIGFSTQLVSTAADQNWVQNNVTVLDNSASNVANTIQSLLVNAQVYPAASNKAYMAILLVTAEDGVIPNFAGNDSALATALNTYRRLIWCTQSGIVKFNAGIADDAMIPFEPNTKRVLKPGQKLIWICLAKNHANSSADSMYYMVDWNLWYDY